MSNTRIGQKFQKGDRVKKRTAGGTKPPRFGTILLATEKNDSRGHPTWYYSVQWDDLKSPSIHAQQALIRFSGEFPNQEIEIPND